MSISTARAAASPGMTGRRGCATRIRARSPASPRRTSDRVEFFEFLQWQADVQLGAAAEAGRAAGLSLGLYRDLAVGVNPHGAEAWADQGLVVPGMGIGAPPDPLSRAGPGLGPRAGQPAGAASARVSAVHRCAARQYAPCRSAADRPCDVAAAALLGAARPDRGQLAPMSLIRSPSCCASSRSKATGRAAPSSAKISAPCRRGFAKRCRRRTCCRIGWSCSSGAGTAVSSRRATTRRWPRPRRRRTTCRP